ncbi:MAG TPA: thiopurine S-methyltransferase [Steroidobacteraceae bacterium]|nr:thiopurine S-methyltransferase [Steroidobacteraceae bacterium]
MEPEFWHDRWRTGRTGFHQASVDRSLQRHWASLGIPEGTPVFVPLCGKSLDLLWLRDRGHRVSGIELSATAVEAFFLENGVAARRRPLPLFDVYEAERLRLIRGDFFALREAMLGAAAAVYDRAALISWAPSFRPLYVDHLASLLASGTRLLLISLEYPQSEMRGPPFSVTGEEVRRLYGSQFEIDEIDRRDVLAHEARLRAAGVTQLFEVCYRLVRR